MMASFRRRSRSSTLRTRAGSCGPSAAARPCRARNGAELVSILSQGRPARVVPKQRAIMLPAGASFQSIHVGSSQCPAARHQNAIDVVPAIGSIWCFHGENNHSSGRRTAKIGSTVWHFLCSCHGDAMVSRSPKASPTRRGHSQAECAENLRGRGSARPDQGAVCEWEKGARRPWPRTASVLNAYIDGRCYPKIRTRPLRLPEAPLLTAPLRKSSGV